VFIQDPDELDPVAREIRINELKHRASELTDGQMTVGGSEDIPPELEEAFWQHVVDYESAPMTSNAERLGSEGVELPPADELTDEQLCEKLWEVIEALAKLRTFLHCTDHMSDRELYVRLREEALIERKAEMPLDANSAWHIDFVSSGSDEDISAWLTYYAGEPERTDWRKEWPDDPVPDHQDPPFDRDRHLPGRW